MLRAAMLLLALALAAPAAGQVLDLRSPDGRNPRHHRAQRIGDAALCRVARRCAGAQPFADPDRPRRRHARLWLRDRGIGAGLPPTRAIRSSPARPAEGRDHYNQLTVHYQERGGDKRRMDVVLRAYDDGVAFRTVIPVPARDPRRRWCDTSARASISPKPGNAGVFNVGRFGSNHEGEFDPVDTARMRDHNLFSLPFVC
ncbi:MAG: glycoside hydrolase family 97 N-terminal domain-containing protein [Sphingomonas sp.]